MSDKITFNRTVSCSAINKDVYQELTYAKFQTIGSLMASKKLISTFCMGYPNCDKQDCQLVVGKAGRVYSKPIED
ncbi:hypothetical protein BVF91_05970 [Thermoanaerobacterium sp. PSU-2]|uniref:hypothetical protein n=1 Tax=Thermoanaerobacterium sp. PSU-2 TaxID=1930849 RepID=UPI000A164B21|nr:hypothetical protein [Thermoanaerobacterium sp. PSU-2]ORX23376.1 hypothetical protein BVF91_05970 [Thermoanaerobacterium sp. PSU-2]